MMDAAHRGTPAVQAKGKMTQDPAVVHSAAAAGVAGGGGLLPHLSRIQQSFGSGHDVSGIRSHVGGAAAASCDTIGATAYATGNAVAFQSAPDLHTAAHEAAHVVQQRNGVQLEGGVGQVGDIYERHADAVADLVTQGKSAAGLLDSMAGRSTPATATQAAVQRTAKESNYGTFTDEKYDIDGRRLHMTLKFTPNEKVDATKIGLTQVVRPTVGGKKAAARMTSKGHFIDKMTSSNSPVYGAENLGPGKGLEDTAETNKKKKKTPTELNPDKGLNATYDLGHRYQAEGMWKTKDAGLYDAPTIPAANNSCSEFETTAIALDGNQKGQYYGSVKWGFEKDDSGTVSKIDFDVVSMGVPSRGFMAAAAKWNASKTRGSMTPKEDGTKVLDPDTKAESFTIDTGVKLKYLGTIDFDGALYAAVMVSSPGPYKAKTGYVKVDELNDMGDGDAMAKLPIVHNRWGSS